MFSKQSGFVFKAEEMGSSLKHPPRLWEWDHKLT